MFDDQVAGAQGLPQRPEESDVVDRDTIAAAGYSGELDDDVTIDRPCDPADAVDSGIRPHLTSSRRSSADRSGVVGDHAINRCDATNRALKQPVAPLLDASHVSTVARRRCGGCPDEAGLEAGDQRVEDGVDLAAGDPRLA